MKNSTKPMKVIIAGSRHFHNYPLLEKECDKLFKKFKVSVIISGGAKGADKLGEHYARKHAIECKKFNADWEKYGKAAGPIRNLEMALHADALIAFLAPNSRGTQSMIDIAKKRNLKILKIVKI